MYGLYMGLSKHAGMEVFVCWAPRYKGKPQLSLEQMEKEEGDVYLAHVQTGKVQWELFSLSAVICSQLFLLIQSVSKLHLQKIKPAQIACVCNF